MDPITNAVRELYERYPYPSGAPALRRASDARLVLSRGSLARAHSGPIQALDAGCGRGVGLLGCASTQPDVQFLGVDLSSAPLAAAEKEAHARKLDNVRFQRINLMTLEGLEAPAGGFDVIYSSGVLHHLSDPLVGLKRLATVLAPHGVISMMVYGRHGRAPVESLARAIDILIPRDRPLEERLRVGRRLAEALQCDPLHAGGWKDLATISDVEFVDRYLHVQETSYDVRELFDLIENAGLSFLSWSESSEWSAEAVFPDGELRRMVQALEPREQYRLIERCARRPRLECLVAHRANAPRPPLRGADVPEALLAANPEVSFLIERRNLREAQRTERVQWKIGDGAPTDVASLALARAILLVSQQTVPFRGGELVRALAEQSIAEKAATSLILDMVKSEILYRPHERDA